MIELKAIRSVPNSAEFLYILLEEREVHQSISHKGMPTFAEHIAFIQSNPYLCWYIVFNGDEQVGSVYLTRQREVGIGILKQFQFQGIGKQAIKLLVAQHPGKFYANINPDNDASIVFFRDNFDGELIQETYECSL